MTNKISVLSRVLLVLSSALLVISVYVPIWQIDLDAPQYPEGLNLKIFADKLGGDVEIINGLNHYIGMKTLHAKDFIEFSILTYIILFYALFALVSAILGKKKIIYTLFTLFVLFGVVAMVDFWRWEYNYGHDLDPHAAIIVPGMAYQPPLIGFKQLLNFGAYSVPDTGGWLFVGSGVLMLFALLLETKAFSRFKKNKIQAAAVAPVFLFIATSCGNKGPQAINLNTDNCDYCKMTISDKRFACELITTKERIYKFDDVACMLAYKKENIEKTKDAGFYVSDYLSPNTLLAADKLHFVEGEAIGSPMGGNVASFSNQDSATAYQNKLSCTMSSWATLNP